MGAEPGRRSLRMPAEKLGPVIVVLSFTQKQFTLLRMDPIRIVLLKLV